MPADGEVVFSENQFLIDIRVDDIASDQNSDELTKSQLQNP